MFNAFLKKDELATKATIALALYNISKILYRKYSMYNNDTQSIPQLKPTLHEEFHVGDEVLVSDIPGVERGTIVGIATCHVVFSYIVELPKELPVPNFPGKAWKCVSVVGGMLKLLHRYEPECEGKDCSMPDGCTECNPLFLLQQK